MCEKRKLDKRLKRNGDGDGDNNDDQLQTRKAKIDGLNTGDRLVHCCTPLSVVMMLSLR